MKLLEITQLSWQISKHTMLHWPPSPKSHRFFYVWCYYTLRGIENFNNLGKLLYFSGPWVFHLSNEKVGIDYIRHFWIPVF